jgi:FkbM family methyltransferase
MSLRYLLGTAKRRLLKRAVAEVYEPAVVAALERLVRPGFVCADVGANVGLLTLCLARCVGDTGSVVAFEAIPDTAALLRATLREHPALAARVTVVDAAVTDGNEPSVELYPARNGSNGEWTISLDFASREDRVAVERPPIRVAAVSLDNSFPPGSRLDLVKMDIEGAEVQAVAGMRRLLAETRPLLVLEFHREVGWPAIPALLEAGYSLENLDGTPLPHPAGPDDVPYQLVARPRIAASSRMRDS